MPNEDQIARVRKLCLGMPQSSEKLSHGEPTFFARKRVFAMISNNHHNDGRVAVWIPAEPGVQAALIREDPLPITTIRPIWAPADGWASNSSTSETMNWRPIYRKPGN